MVRIERFAQFSGRLGKDECEANRSVDGLVEYRDVELELAHAMFAEIENEAVAGHELLVR